MPFFGGVVDSALWSSMAGDRVARNDTRPLRPGVCVTAKRPWPPLPILGGEGGNAASAEIPQPILTDGIHNC